MDFMEGALQANEKKIVAKVHEERQAHYERVARETPPKMQADPWTGSPVEVSIEALPLSHRFLWEPQSKLSSTLKEVESSLNHQYAQ